MALAVLGAPAVLLFAEPLAAADHPSFVVPFVASVFFVPTNKAYRDIRANTMLVLATDRPLDTQALAALNGHDERSQFGAWLIDDAELDTWLALGPQFLLTDDYVPTDNLLTGVFEVKLAVPAP